MMMPAEDYEVCHQLVTKLASKNYSSINYLFLEPVDTTYFPTYDSLISRPMDLGTLQNLLEQGTSYKTRDEFFSDLMLTFQNAVQFHSDIKENSWIVKLAKDMIKLVNKEYKVALQKRKTTDATAETGPAAQVVVAAGGAGGAAGTTPRVSKSKKRKRSTTAETATTTTTTTTSSIAAPVTAIPVFTDSNATTKKQKRKSTSTPSSSAVLAVSTESAAVQAPASVSAPAPPIVIKSSKKSSHNRKKEKEKVEPPKEDLKKGKIEPPKEELKKEKTEPPKEELKKVKTEPPIEELKKEKQSSKPKIKLRLSLKKTKSVEEKKQPSTDNIVVAATAAATPKTTSDAKTKSTTSKSKSSSATATSSSVSSNASRGKELPKKVAAMQQKQKQDPGSTTSATATPPAVSATRPPPSRGKEMPKIVVQQQLTQSTAKQPVASVAVNGAVTPVLPVPSSGSSPALSKAAPTVTQKDDHVAMIEERKVQCLKFLSALKRRQHRSVSWFLKPVNDARIIEDYTAKIPYPMDLGTATSKLENGQYTTVPEFVRDVRRIFGNCLRYNTTAGDTFRPVAVDMARDAESLLAFFLQPSPSTTITTTSTTSLISPPLLYCWQVCVESLGVLLGMKNPEDNLPTAHFFLHPASFYFGGEFPPDYKSKVPVPMDLGTITSNLMEGVYQSVSKFVADCSLVCQNCYKYNGDSSDGAALVAHAQRLQAQMEQQLGALIRYDQTEGTRMGIPVPPAVIPKPPKQFLLAMLQELRENMYTDRFTKLTERAAVPFEKPVDIAIFPDYLNYVKRPMCFDVIQKNIEMNLYETPEDFEYDVQQIFKNCESYNLPKNNDHIIAVSRHLSKVFRKLYHNRTRNYEENALAGNLGLTTAIGATTTTSPVVASPPSSTKVLVAEKRPSSPAHSVASQRSPVAIQVGDKKVKLAKAPSKHLSSSPTHSISSQISSFAIQAGDNKVKPAKAPSKRKISRATSSVTSAVTLSTDPNSSPKIRISTPKIGGSKIGGKKSAQTGDAGGTNSSNASATRPITLHEAIDRVHAQYVGRRSVKELDSWESACHRLYRELLRHTWLSGAHPKFIFHAPITTMFPEIADVYCAKIEKPMDLSTIESKLLCGGLYTSSQDFVNDIALVSANAISFNKLGRDEGVATSCAYYDASTHLLRYSRWLSLDVLSNFLVDDSEIGAAPKDGSYSDWKLTTSYKYAARAEMENIVLKHSMEKSDVGDRFAWMEAEGEKLLKSLRHQSDLRYMTYFISPQYPADYAAFISKPMAWEVVQLSLQQRNYDTLGEAVEDLRLIFSNALRYNARAKGTDTVSGRAYDAAVYMSIKLEAAIQRMLLSVSDRLSRETVEEAIAEREKEAAERSAAMRAREEQIRQHTEWEREQRNNQGGNGEKSEKTPFTTETTKATMQQKFAIKRQSSLIFDYEFNEDDVDNTRNQEQAHMEAMRQQKVLFEKQKNERKIWVKTSKSISASLFFKLVEKEKQIAAEAIMQEQQQSLQKTGSNSDAMDIDDTKGSKHSAEATVSLMPNTGSMMSMEKKPIKIALVVDEKQQKKKSKSGKGRLGSSRITFFDDDD